MADNRRMTFAANPDAQPADPDVRMLTTLLASCDPCRAIAAGGSPQDYAETARDVLITLEAGAGVADVLLTLPQAEVEMAHRFALVALHWWSNRVVTLGGVPASSSAQLQSV